MKKPPLWMPEGSVRGILALIITGTFCGVIASLAWYSKIDITGKDVVYVVIIVLQAYFQKRENTTEEPPQKSGKTQEGPVNEIADEV